MEKNQALKHRKTEHEVDAIFPSRWSPRAMSGEEISEEELMRLFEAAKWAPSSRNNQPWRFVYARKNTPHWEKFYSLLADGNKRWAENSAVLIVIASKKTFERD